MARKNTIIDAAMIGVMTAETAVAKPPRNRSSSFASMVADLRVGDTPAAKVMDADGTSTLEETLDALPALIERHRNNVNSAVVRAKDRNLGAEYAIEVTHFLARRSLYIVALVTRTA